jgi:predicted MFS family arabinose efflux permease
VPESRDDTAPDRLDWLGAILAATGLGAFVYGLIEANSRGFSDPIVLVAIIAGIILLIAFIITESRGRAPMMPLHLFESRNFSGANLLTLLLYAGLNGMFFFLGFNLIQVQGYSATATGAALLPFIILLSTLSRWAGGLTARRGAKLPLVVGPTIAALGYALMAFSGTGGSYWTTFFPAITLAGLGMAITVAPLTSTVMGSVDERHAGTASGINNAVSWMSGLLAIAALGIVAAHIFATNLDRSIERLPISASLRADLTSQSSKLAAIEIPPSLQGGLREQVEESIDAAFVEAFRVIMFICSGLALAGGIAAGILVEGRKSKV